ncbi:hypothetical protein HYH03_002162 [Edaphochlamys debaryana]|uniref:Uncharacterized protein n=1 Tax=Edaphochlamys debaryana TaxID=47281 RepID=A0A836C479_9CHLO|nr:hypothetical protein HYH03_002162 [Edaphochlamys debaryana]|eukprot:KAG2499871.1 hypothetical protein HYH03_002162 [Edaphochlamys debaryana]
MSMFADGGARTASKASTSGRGTTGTTPRRAAASSGGGAKPGEGSKRLSPSGQPSGKAAAGAGARPAASPAGAAGKQPRGAASAAVPNKAAAAAQPGPGAGAKALAGRKQKRGGSAQDEIEAIMRAGKKKAKKAAAAAGAGADSAKPSAAATAAAAAEAASKAAHKEAMRRERKAFMSHKASKVHAPVQAVAGPKRAVPASDEEAALSPEEFQRLHLEVEKFAAASLDKKSAKAYKARMLARLGAKADARPRIPSSIGFGMAKMAAKREAKALEEAIETGMVQRKGLGKKKRALQAKNRDRGLMEAGPSFKGGVLRIKPLKKQRQESATLRLPKGML